MASSQNTNPKKDQRDKDLAADTRPLPSQAEGDLETVNQDLESPKTDQTANKK